MPQAATQDDWGDAPAQAAPDERFAWGDEGEKQQAAAPAATATQPGTMRRFWNGIKAGSGGENALNTAVDPAHPISSNPMIPGAGVYRDIESGNYAGAAGRVLGPAAALALTVGNGRGLPEEAPVPERVPLWKQAGIEAGAPPSTIDATPMTPRPIHSPGAPPVPSAPVGPRVPLWRRAGIEAGAPPSTVDATPMEPYTPVRAPRVMPGPAQPPVEAPFRRPDLPAPYATEEKAWHRYPAVDSAQDLAETKDIQASVRDQAEGEQRNMLRRGTEEGFARNTRPRTSKGELTKQFQGARTPGAKASGTDYPAADLNSEKELTDLLKRSLELATKVKPRK